MIALFKNLLAAVTALVAFCPPPAWAIEAPDAVKVDGKIDWVYDYEEGKRLSRESGKPMFVVFRCER